MASAAASACAFTFVFAAVSATGLCPLFCCCFRLSSCCCSFVLLHMLPLVLLCFSSCYCSCSCFLGFLTAWIPEGLLPEWGIAARFDAEPRQRLLSASFFPSRSYAFSLFLLFSSNFCDFCGVWKWVSKKRKDALFFIIKGLMFLLVLLSSLLLLLILLLLIRGCY